MPVHVIAYIFVIGVSVMTLAFFRKPFAAQLGRKRFDTWALAWMVATTCVFLLTNFWVAMIGVAVIAAYFARAEPVKPAIYLLFLCVAPAMGLPIPGFAGINKFIEIEPQLVVAAVVLIPSLFVAARMKRLNKVGAKADMFFLLYLILQVSLSIRAPSFTHMLRTGLEDFLFLTPIYYVVSRWPKSVDDVCTLTAAIVLPVLILSAVAVPEFSRNWHFYFQIIINWLGEVPFGYSMREGYLRATASVFNPIVWGYVAMCAIGLGLALLNDGLTRLYKLAAFGLLVTGLLLSLSRGPWIGTIIIIGVYIMLSRNAVTRSIQAGAVAIVAGLLSLLTPFGRSVIGLLPVVGGGVNDTIDYRQQLLDAAWDVILQNPLFGSANYLQNSALQNMRQGQGIIDIVNTYLQVGLKSGLVGLSLFIGFFAFVLGSLMKAHKTARAQSSPLENYCRAYIATLVGILVTIFTTSSEGQIPHLYWVVAALGVAISRIAAEAPDAHPVAGAAQADKTKAGKAHADFNWK